MDACLVTESPILQFFLRVNRRIPEYPSAKHDDVRSFCQLVDRLSSPAEDVGVTHRTH